MYDVLNSLLVVSIVLNRTDEYISRTEDIRSLLVVVLVTGHRLRETDKGCAKRNVPN